MQHNQKKKPQLPVQLSPQTIEQIIHRWKTSKLNVIPEIAIEFKLPESRIHCIINKHLSLRILP